VHAEDDPAYAGDSSVRATGHDHRRLSAVAASVRSVHVEEAVRRVAEIAAALPQTHEQDAWVGVRWRVRSATFAHVFPAADDKPAGSARHTGSRAPAVLLVFHAPAADAAVYAELGLPWFKPDWSPTVAGLVLDDDTDWDEVAEVVTDSYCVRAPKRLAADVQRIVDESGTPPRSE
jgi:hypothetical protein